MNVRAPDPRRPGLARASRAFREQIERTYVVTRDLPDRFNDLLSRLAEADENASGPSGSNHA